MRWPWRHTMRAKNSTAGTGRCEADVSRERLHRVRREIVEPLRAFEESNQFAALIRASLTGEAGDRGRPREAR